MLEDRSPEFQAFMKVIHDTASERHAATADIEGIRQVMDGFVGEFALDADVVVEPVDCAGVPAEWISVDESLDDRVVMYIHGGCYISGSPGVVREFCARLARAGECRVLSIDYRLAPEHPFPAALDDCVVAYRWLLDRFDAARVVIAGESAGGGLTIATLMRCRDLGLALPGAGIPISPWVDMTVSFGDSLVRNDGRDMASVAPLRLGADAYVGDRHREDPLASPLLASNLEGLPPMLVQVGTAEVLLDEGREMAARLERAGCDVTLDEWEDMTHVWHWYGPYFPEARDAIRELGAYVRERVPA